MTIYNLPANKLGQLAGAPSAPMGVQAGAAAVRVDAANAINRIDGDSAVSATVAVTCTNVPLQGIMVLLLRATGVGTVTYTMGAGFLVGATAAPTTGKQIAISFVSNGTNFVEIGRSSTAL